jgi:hypothetical protein
MSDDKDSFVERRAYRRFYLEGLALNNSGSTCAHIMDIGMGGMAFRYVEDSSWANDSEELGTISGQSFHLEGIPLVTVSESAFDNGIYTIKRCGLKFGNLTPDQRYKIEKIITEYGVKKEESTLPD